MIITIMFVVMMIMVTVKCYLIRSLRREKGDSSKDPRAPLISRGLDPSHEISSQFIDHLLSWQKLPTSHKSIFKIQFLLSDKSSWHKKKINVIQSVKDFGKEYIARLLLVSNVFLVIMQSSKR